MKSSTRIATLLLAAACGLLPAVAKADPPKDGSKARKLIKLDEISVEGRIQKPQAFYILPRSSLNYSALDQQESFLPKIKKAVRQEPF